MYSLELRESLGDWSFSTDKRQVVRRSVLGRLYRVLLSYNREETYPGYRWCSLWLRQSRERSQAMSNQSITLFGKEALRREKSWHTPVLIHTLLWLLLFPFKSSSRVPPALVPCQLMFPSIFEWFKYLFSDQEKGPPAAQSLARVSTSPPPSLRPWWFFCTLHQDVKML